MNERMQQLRKQLGLNQESFGKTVGLSKSAISNIESGRYGITDTIIKLVCQNFNVSEEWLKCGIGEMFNEQAVSLDDYAKQNDLDELEVELIKIVMSIPKEERKKAIDKIRKAFFQADAKEEMAATTITSAKFSPTPVTQEHPQEMDVDENLEQEANEFAEMAKRQFLSEKRRASKASFAKESDAG